MEGSLPTVDCFELWRNDNVIVTCELKMTATSFVVA